MLDHARPHPLLITGPDGSPIVAPSTDHTFLTALINHATVRPYMGLAQVGHVDSRLLLASPGALAVRVGEVGAFFLFPVGDTAFEWHSAFLPEGRGRTAIRAAKVTQDMVFQRTNIDTLITYVPIENRAAMVAASAVGFVELKRCDGEALRGEPGEISLRELTRERWMQLRAGEAH